MISVYKLQTKDVISVINKTLINNKGVSRKIGLELEFAGLEIKKTVHIIQNTFGGQIVERNRYNIEVQDTDLGDFRVELDARILQKMAGNDMFGQLGIDIDQKKIKESLESIVDKFARSVIPLEVVMPPIEIEQLPELERLRELLQKNKAEGTESSLVHAFGMHINIEVPDLEIETLLAYLRSFLLLYPWLLYHLNVNVSRRISPFVDPFPDEYLEKVLDVYYVPGKKEFIDDYLEFSTTRNRPLDLMPVLAMLDEKSVSKAMEGEKNNPRPTFHYRLPNSRIDNPGWSFTTEWQSWLAVEGLAQNDEMIKKLSKLYVLKKRQTVVSFKKEWAETINILLGLNEKKKTNNRGNRS